MEWPVWGARVVLVAVAITALTACGRENGEQRAAAGQEVYVRECARCHMTSGTGVAGVYPNLRRNPIVTLENPEAMIEIVLEGRESMPAFGTQLPEQKLAQVISYVRRAWGNNASTVS